MVRWIPDDAATEEELLRAAGLPDAEALFADVPRRVRLGRMGVGPARDELEVVRTLEKALKRNRPYTEFASFLGGRIAPRYVPAAVETILQRSEFYTSYTPYQPEASQGMLQALFEFQSLWVELTGMDVANASLYDGATAAGEAMLLARRAHEGRRFLVPASLPWEEKSVLANYGVGTGATIGEIPYDARTGRLDLAWVKGEVAKGDVFGVLADLPNGFGLVDEGLLDLKSAIGGVPFVVVADPLALSVLAPPGDWGADIVVGEGQGFGAAPGYGGPLLGLLACRRDYLRHTPGRIVGATKDAEGRPAFTLTLQTREQHIRRSRATSNICTNESLLALAFVVYATTVGPRGLAELERSLSEKARTLANALSSVEGLRAPRFDAPYLHEFAVEVARGTVGGFLDRLRRQKVLGGHTLADPRPNGAVGAPPLYLTAATEYVGDKEIAKYASAARKALARVPEAS